MTVFSSNKLSDCDLVVDAIYEGLNNGNVGDDPIGKIIPVGNQGGFRFKGALASPDLIVLYTSGHNPDWPDEIDVHSGVFQYFGDNRRPGKELHDTTRGGNQILRNVFASTHASESPRSSVPPILIFEKHPTPNSSRSVIFRGLCVPGASHLDASRDLVAIWRTTGNERFQNYKAAFTILDVPVIKREWLTSILNREKQLSVPDAFAEWKKSGVITPLKAPRTSSIRTVQAQLPSSKLDREILQTVYNHFSSRPTQFEFFAADLYAMSNPNVIIDTVTRGSVDGGRDAIGRLRIGITEDPIHVDFALEAKCYNPGLLEKLNTVGVKETSRLISRIRNRQYGVLVTTSAVAKQAYQEIREDGHPIILLAGVDLVRILRASGYSTPEEVKLDLAERYPVD